MLLLANVERMWSVSEAYVKRIYMSLESNLSAFCYLEINLHCVLEIYLSILYFRFKIIGGFFE
jgi:hypothetical protein